MEPEKNSETTETTMSPEEITASVSGVEAVSENNSVGEAGASNKTAGKKKRKKKSARYYAISLAVKLVLTGVVLWLLLGVVGGIYVNHDYNSYPMIKDGDLCIIYRLGELKAGAEVVYEKDGKIRFGRIAACPGDSVEIKGDVFTVNGMNLLEDVVYPTSDAGSKISYPYKVPDGSYFILNDFRSNSDDSRSFGAVEKKAIKGQVVFVMRRRGI